LASFFIWLLLFCLKRNNRPFFIFKRHEATKQIDIVNSKVKIEPIKLAGLMITHSNIITGICVR
jgi:hypothetical protein